MKENRIIDIPAAPVCGIYSLVDNNGKRYIGSSKNIKQRVLSHSFHMNNFAREGKDGFLNPSLEKAVADGLFFRCEVLAEFHCSMSKDELREIERIFINKFGGIQNTHNYQPINHKI